MRPQFVAILICLAIVPAQAQVLPYAGQEQHPIKALSADEVDGLLQGRGMGLAKAAELNGYPGPMHVLELAADLGLTAEQTATIEAIWSRMGEEARKLGGAIVDREGDLDRLFAERRIDSATLAQRTAEIGALQARLRAVHLAAHLETRPLLSDRQAIRYEALRGYAAAPRAPGHHRN